MAVHGKLIIGILFSEKTLLAEALERFSTQSGLIQRKSPCHRFDETAYYAKEMNANLFRQFFSFSGVIELENVICWKKWAQEVEHQFCKANKRQVNIDPGYVDLHKVVLLSAKSGGHKIYLGQEVWADMALMKNKAGYGNFQWTFPDLRQHKYDTWFLQVRLDFKNEIKIS